MNINSTTDAEIPDVLTVSEAAEFLRISRPTLVELVAQGVLPGRKLGNQWRFYKQSLIRYLSGEALTSRSRSKHER